MTRRKLLQWIAKYLVPVSAGQHHHREAIPEADFWFQRHIRAQQTLPIPDTVWERLENVAESFSIHGACVSYEVREEFRCFDDDTSTLSGKTTFIIAEASDVQSTITNITLVPPLHFSRPSHRWSWPLAQSRNNKLFTKESAEVRASSTPRPHLPRVLQRDHLHIS